MPIRGIGMRKIPGIAALAMIGLVMMSGLAVGALAVNDQSGASMASGECKGDCDRDGAMCGGDCDGDFDPVQQRDRDRDRDGDCSGSCSQARNQNGMGSG